MESLLETLSLNALTLARIQFAFTISFHIIFPSFTIGLASWLAVVEWRYLATKNIVYKVDKKVDTGLIEANKSLIEKKSLRDSMAVYNDDKM